MKDEEKYFSPSHVVMVMCATMNKSKRIEVISHSNKLFCSEISGLKRMLVKCRVCNAFSQILGSIFTCMRDLPMPRNLFNVQS